jgi:hypothetical protein
VVGGDDVSHSAKNNHLRQRCGRNGAIERQRHFPALPAPFANRDGRDLQNTWQQIGTIATEAVLPKVAAARERDHKARILLGLPPHNWESGS